MSALSEAPDRSGRLLVLALGCTLRGDDGVGPAVLQELAAQGPLLDGVDLVDGGTPGLETALLLEGYQRAIIIDAAEMGRRPGEWARLEVDPEGSLQGRGVEDGALPQATTLHQAGLAEALVLGATLRVLPEAVTIYGGQPLECGWSPGLSGPVKAAIGEVCRAIGDEIGSAEAAGQAKLRGNHGQDSRH